MDLEMVLKKMLGAYRAGEGSEAHRPCGAMNTGRDTWLTGEWYKRRGSHLRHREGGAERTRCREGLRAQRDLSIH